MARTLHRRGLRATGEPPGEDVHGQGVGEREARGEERLEVGPRVEGRGPPLRPGAHRRHVRLHQGGLVRLQGGELRVGEPARRVAGRVAPSFLPRQGHLERVRAEDVRLDELLEPGGIRDDVLHGGGIAGRGAVPHAAAEGGDVDLRGVLRVGDHALAPLEVVAPDPRPRLAAVDGAERGLVEAAGVHPPRIAGVDRHVVDVLRLGEDGTPRGAGVRAEEDASPRVAVRARHPPRREVEPLRVLRVDGETVRPVRPGRQREGLPVLRAVGRAVEGTVVPVADPARARSAARPRGRARRPARG